MRARTGPRTRSASLQAWIPAELKSRTTISILVALAVVFGRPLAGQQQTPPQPVFRSTVNLVLVDVVVRDRKGAIVIGLKADDFQLVEDGKPQQILTFAFEQIEGTAAPVERASLLAGATAGSPPRVTAPAAAPPAGTAARAAPLTSEEVAGHRLLTLLFDTSSMQPEDVQKATDEAIKWVDEKMSPADLVAVATIGSTLQVLSDFTSEKEQVRSVLEKFSAADGTAFSAVDASTQATDEAASSQTDDTTTTDVGAQELDTFNNDVRLRALRTLAEALAPIQQKKAILYFSSGMQRNGTDNQVDR